MTHPRVALMFITDGRRDCARRTLDSLRETLAPEGCGNPFFFDYTVVVDDGCDVDYSKWLDEYHWDRHLLPGRTKRGFDGAIRAGWGAVALESKCDYLFHLEDDYVFNRHFSIAEMIRLLERYPEMVQVALKRQPWGGDADHPNGFVGKNPDAYEDHTEVAGTSWFQHRLFFSTNPSLYRTSLCEREWPVGEQSEGRFHHELMRECPESFYAYLGHKDDEPRVTHIGVERTGIRY